jgi:hypothetical protein
VIRLKRYLPPCHYRMVTRVAPFPFANDLVFTGDSAGINCITR